MIDEPLLRDDAGGICTLTLNRPDKLNALDGSLFRRLEEEVDRLEQETDRVGCVLLRGAGRGFSAGADLAALKNGTLAARDGIPRLIERFANLPQPLIAVVHGPCLTGGLELALAADFIVADRSARIADTHARWGLVGGWGMSQRLPRRVGQARALRITVTGEPVPVDQALAIGLIDLLTDEGRADAEAMALATTIVANSWFTSREVKRLLRETAGMSVGAGLAHEQYHHPGRAPDSEERIAAFIGRSRS